VKSVLTPGHFLKVLLVWTGIAVGIFFLCMSVSGKVGAVGIDWGWPHDPDLRDVRMRPVLAAAIVGFALSAAGVTLQALLRNPLADPYVLGISSGSTVGVMAWLLATSTMFAAGGETLQGAAAWLAAAGQSLPAVIGAMLTCVIVFALARSRLGGGGGIQPVTLLLVGAVVSSMNAALLMVLNSLAPHGLRADIGTFLLGSISESVLSWRMLIVAASVLLAGFVPTLLSAAALNIGVLSDTEATSLGINVQRLRVLCFVCASVMTGGAILLSGPIGFVGLICPHICRRLKWIGGADHRTLLISAPLCGAAFLMLANSAVNVAITLKMGQFPVGVVTALCGGPFFLYLLKRSAR